MEWIVKVQEKQDDFIRIIHDLGEHFYAEDIVQEFYIKLMKYGKEEIAIKDGELNMGYLYTILKNLFLNYHWPSWFWPRFPGQRNMHPAMSSWSSRSGY